jgi:hypothetical protein
MRQDEWNDSGTIVDSLSKSAVLGPKLGWERMPIFLASNNGVGGRDPLAASSQVLLGCNATGLPRSSDAQKPRVKACQPARVRYYDVTRHWTQRIEPHLQDEMLNKILIADFNDYTQGRWGLVFYPGTYPEGIESCDWRIGRRGRPPRYWKYVKHGACHWIVNFCLRLASLAEPSRKWRILTSDEHSTVWDAQKTLFEFNYLALGISAEECFSKANDQELLPGEYLVCRFDESQS